MSTSQSDAVAQVPSFEQQMSQFKGFSTTDGEVSDGKSTPEENAILTARAAQQTAGKTTTEEKPAAGAVPAAKAAEITLTDQEEQAALDAAVAAKGGELTDDEADAAVERAVASKGRAAAMEKRRAEKAARFRALDGSARRLERENAELKARLTALEKGAAGKPLTEGGKANNDSNVPPDHTDAEKYKYGELDAKYLADLARYETLKVLAESKQSEQKTHTSEAEAKQAAEFQTRVNEFDDKGAEQFEDFEAVVIASRDLDPSDPDYWPLSKTLGELLLESDHGPAVAYELALDPKEARRINRLPVGRQAIWFGQQEARLTASAAASDQTKGGAGAAAAKAAPTQQSQVRESKAPIPLRSARRLTGQGGNQVPTSATTDFAAFEALAKETARKR